MARLTDTLRSALGYWWNLITDAAREGFTASETVQLANQVSQDLGAGGLKPDVNRAVASLYGYARREINAGLVLDAAQASDFINSDMISTPPYARADQEQRTYPVYNVKFDYTYIDQNGVQHTDTKTSVFDDGLPETVGDLFSAVLDDAEGIAAKYGHTLISAIPRRILEV